MQRAINNFSYLFISIFCLLPEIALADCPSPIVTTVTGPCNVSGSGLSVSSGGVLDAGTGQYAINQTSGGGNISIIGSIVSNYYYQSNPLIAIRNNAAHFLILSIKALSQHQVVLSMR